MIDLYGIFWCPLTESNCQSMITSQVLYHLTKGANLFCVFHRITSKPDILTYFTSFRLGLPLEIGVFFSSAGAEGGVLSTGKDIP